MPTLARELLVSVFWSGIGVALLFVAALLFDLFYPIKIRKLIEEGNTAAGLLLAGVMIGIAFIVASVITAG